MRTTRVSVLQDLESKIRPTHGTAYGAGFSSAWDVASGGEDDAGEQFVLIFLSDGRVRENIIQLGGDTGSRQGQRSLRPM